MLSALKTFFFMFCGLRKDRKLLLLTIQLNNSTIFHIKAKPSMKIEEIKA